MVQQIQALRTKKREEEGESGAEGEWPSARLHALEEELLLRQQDAPLVLSQVDESVIAAIVADWTGIPVGRMVQDEVAAVFRLESTLGERVVGQDRALGAIAERIRVSRARLTDPTSRSASSCWSVPQASARPKPRWHWRTRCMAASRTSSPST
jgi:type VI secretion system protein VasG